MRPIDAHARTAMPPLSRQDRSVAAVTLLTGLLGAGWLGYLARHTAVTPGLACSQLALAGCGIVAGIGAWRGRGWARWLGVAFFAVQSVQLAMPALHYRLVLGLNLTVSIDSGEDGRIGFNLFALAMTAWSMWRAWRASRSPIAAAP